MAVYKPYRVEYTFRQPKLEVEHPDRPFSYLKPVIDTFTVINEKVISDSPTHAVRDGLADGLILQHLLKHCMKLVHWEVREI